MVGTKVLASLCLVGALQPAISFPNFPWMNHFEVRQGIVAGYPNQSYGFGTWNISPHGHQAITIKGKHYEYQYSGKLEKHQVLTLKNVPFDTYVITYRNPGYLREEVPFNYAYSQDYVQQVNTMHSSPYIVARTRSNQHLSLQQGPDGKYRAYRKDGTWEFNEAGKYTVTIYKKGTNKKLYSASVSDARPIDFSHVPYQKYSVKLHILDTTEQQNDKNQIVVTRPRDKTTTRTFSYANSWEKDQHLSQRMNYTGILKNPYNKNWYYVKNGNYQKKSTIAKNDNGWYCTDKNGKVRLQYTGLAKKAKKQWYYCKKGKVDFSKNGLAPYQKSKYLVQKGKVNFQYNGRYRVNGKTYQIKHGKVI